MTLATIQSLIELLIFFLAYAVSVTFGGAFQAFVADRMGDDTAKDVGMASLNPLVHIDPLGLLCLYLFHIGWGRPVPIDERNIRSTPKLLCAYFANVIMYIMIAIVALVILVALFGRGPVTTGGSFDDLYRSYPQYATLLVALLQVLLGFISVNAWLSALEVIRSGFKIVLQFFFPEVLEDSDMQYIVNFGPLLLMLLFLQPLTMLIGKIIGLGGHLIATLLRI